MDLRPRVLAAEGVVGVVSGDHGRGQRPQDAEWAEVGDGYHDADDNKVLRPDESESEVKDFKSKDRTVLRSRLTVKYNIRHCPVNPYASVDYGCGLNYTTNKWKYTAGADINLTKSKQHKMDVFYRYQTEDDDDEPNGHLIGVGYKLKF